MNDGIDAAGQRPVLVFWTAPWCGPCRLSIPVVKEIIKLYANKIEALEVCTDDLPEVAADAGVVSIPTIHLYFRGAYPIYTAAAREYTYLPCAASNV